MSKGQYQTLEATIAIASILIVAFTLYRIGEIPDLEPAILKQKVLDALSALDNSGKLRKEVLDENTTAIESQLKDFFPLQEFEVTLCSRTSCSIPTFNEKTTIYSVSYFLSGDIGNPKPYEVIVYFW